MGNQVDYSARIRETKLGIIDLETNLECVVKKLKRKPKDTKLLAQKNLYQGLLAQKKQQLEKLSLLSVTKSSAKSTYNENDMIDQMDSLLEEITEKVGDVLIEEEEDSRDDKGGGNAPIIVEEEEEAWKEMEELLIKPKPIQFPSAPTSNLSTDLIKLETRLMRLNSVEKRLEELDKFEEPLLS